jgi:hypothetical protein
MAVMNIIAAANPFVLMAIALGALVAGLVVAYHKVGWFKDGVNAMGRFAVDAFNNVSNAVRNVIGWVSSLFNGFRIPGWLRDVMRFMGVGAVGFDYGDGMTMKGLIGGPSLAGLGEDMGAVGPGSLVGLFSGGGSTSSTVNNYSITIDGALDPVAVAKQIKKILNSDAQRTGSLDIGGSLW